MVNAILRLYLLCYKQCYLLTYKAAEFKMKISRGENGEGWMQEPELGRSIRSAGVNVQYDAQCKKILGNKEILAWILRGTMKEFRGKDLDFIKDCIEGTPEISTVKVNPGETNGPKRERVTGMPNEDKEPGEGAIYYDIRFYVNIPESGEEVRMIINVEGQKSFYPGYQIVTRGIFYAARMLSAQLGTEFSVPEYDGLKKCYSIWICLGAPQKIGNAVSEYAIYKRDLIKGIPDQRAAYDKLSVIILTLNPKCGIVGVDAGDETGRLLQMLLTVMAPDMGYQEKRQKMEKEYQMDMGKGLGKELELMCNLSGYVEARGRELGIAEGKRQMIFVMFKRNLPDEEIADYSGYSIEEIRRLREESKAENSRTSGTDE